MILTRGFGALLAAIGVVKVWNGTTWDVWDFGAMVPEYFLDLEDTPEQYTGDGERLVTVKSSVDGLEFGRKITASDSPPSGGEDGDIHLEW